MQSNQFVAISYQFHAKVARNFCVKISYQVRWWCRKQNQFCTPSIRKINLERKLKAKSILHSIDPQNQFGTKAESKINFALHRSAKSIFH
ncbi:MAG: hypothetical protein DRR00_10205 [Candidatus Parabeggiatoa sp. nov. 3]|nr:MAG: hypothetical protein DRR00_10205 [Gammaproteobacteria bacterium]RKZ60922.1 MAG: hypothetical protein DRQ99_21315 [Gammaproteobacteria bacterium]